VIVVKCAVTLISVLMLNISVLSNSYKDGCKYEI